MTKLERACQIESVNGNFIKEEDIVTYHCPCDYDMKNTPEDKYRCMRKVITCEECWKKEEGK